MLRFVAFAGNMAFHKENIFDVNNLFIDDTFILNLLGAYYFVASSLSSSIGRIPHHNPSDLGHPPLRDRHV